jgi:hypothetical protein
MKRGMMKGTVTLLAFLLFASGCAYFQKSSTPDQAAKPKTETPNVVFYTFPDIPVPKELALVRERSFIYETPSVKAGVLVLTGNVEMPSLESYFRANMAKNGWRFLNSYKYNDMILNFLKDDKASTIRATRDTFTTQVEIWVGPVERNGQPFVERKENGLR